MGTSAGFDGRPSCPCCCVKEITDLSLWVYGLSHSTVLWAVKEWPVSLSPRKVSLNDAIGNGEPTCLSVCMEGLCPWHRWVPVLEVLFKKTLRHDLYRCKQAKEGWRTNTHTHTHTILHWKNIWTLTPIHKHWCNTTPVHTRMHMHTTGLNQS